MSRGTFRVKLKILWPIIWKYKFSLANLFLCVLVTSVIGMVYPYIFGLLIDEVFYHRNIAFFKFIVLGYGIIYLSETGLHFVLNSVWSYLVTRFSFDIRKKLYDKLLSLQSSFFHNSRTGDIMIIINRDADEVMNLIHWNIFYLTANVIRLLTAVVFVLNANVYLGLIMLVVIPVVVLVTRAFAHATKVRVEEQRTQYGKFMSWCVEMLAGLRDIRLMAVDSYINRQFVRLIAQYMRLTNRTSTIQYYSNRAVSFVTLISDLILYISASLFIIKGNLTVGSFIAVIDYFFKANGLLQNLSGASARLQQNKVALNRVFGLLGEQEEMSSVGASKLVVSKGTIEFEEVSFRYRSETPVLTRLNIRIEGGETVAIVGKSGSGKTTLISLLLRFYEPSEGHIWIDGMSIKDCIHSSVRKSIAVALQEPFLFEGTIRANLQWGNTSLSDNQLWMACQSAYIEDYVRSLPKGLDTIIGGASGISMSGGQKQRIAIARIFLKQPRIFVFDEATSALDREAEEAIKTNLKQLGEHSTKIIIAHRLSSILTADKVAVLEEGRIVAYGQHQELLQTSDTYQKLFQEQYAEYKEEKVI
ncbi:ABC transporter ATP-binding protein [Paenibacillus sp. IITD108]